MRPWLRRSGRWTATSADTEGNANQGFRPNAYGKRPALTGKGTQPMGYDYDYSGADADALALLGGYQGGSVSGVDYVGAAPTPAVLRLAQTMQPVRGGGMHFSAVNPQAAMLMEAGKKAIDFSQKIAHDRRLRNAALSGYVPQIE